MAISNWGCYLKNAGVNGGTAVLLGDVSISYTFKKLVRADPVIGKSTSYRYDIASGDRAGVENPVITIDGVIDLNDTTSTNIITEKLLKDFWRDEANDTYLTIGLGNGTSPVQVSNYKGTYDIGYGSANNIKVEIMSMSMNMDNSAERGHIIRYTIQLMEVA